MTITQLDLFTHTAATSRTIPEWGRCITSPADTWRAKWAGTRWGWTFHRYTDEGRWESWEPELPYGLAHVLDRVMAETLIAGLVNRYGDRPLVIR